MAIVKRRGSYTMAAYNPKGNKMAKRRTKKKSGRKKPRSAAQKAATKRMLAANKVKRAGKPNPKRAKVSRISKGASGRVSRSGTGWKWTRYVGGRPAKSGKAKTKSEAEKALRRAIRGNPTKAAPRRKVPKRRTAARRATPKTLDACKRRVVSLEKLVTKMRKAGAAEYKRYAATFRQVQRLKKKVETMRTAGGGEYRRYQAAMREVARLKKKIAVMRKAGAGEFKRYQKERKKRLAAEKRARAAKKAKPRRKTKRKAAKRKTTKRKATKRRAAPKRKTAKRKAAPKRKAASKRKARDKKRATAVSKAGCVVAGARWGYGPGACPPSKSPPKTQRRAGQMLEKRSHGKPITLNPAASKARIRSLTSMSGPSLNPGPIRKGKRKGKGGKKRRPSLTSF